jgi:hypothetical protein
MNPQTNEARFNPVFWLIFSVLLLPLMLSNESLWIDEGDTARYALQPDFHAWWHYLNHDTTANCQMPLAMFFAWVTAQTLGTQEWQLRAINVLWNGLALLGMYRAGKRLQLPWLPLLLAIQPYFWFYSNEARPYSLQIACGAWLFAGFVEFLALKGAGETWTWLFSGAAVFLCFATLLAPLPIAACLIAGGVMAGLQRWKISRKSVLILLGGAAASIPPAIYYFSTLARGAKSAQIWHVDLKFFGYVTYELTGMSGLGLATQNIREIARSSHLYGAIVQHGVQFILPAVCFLLLLLLLAWGLRQRLANAQAGICAGIVAVLCITSFVFISVGICIQKAFWARHFAPVFPFYVALLGMAISSVLETRRFYLRLLPGLLIGLLLFSALNLRFAERHRKEDYRSAAQFARHALAEKKSVWWVASGSNAQYYHLDCALSRPEAGRVFLPQSVDIENIPAPDVIICSKPEIFDPGAAVQNLIQQKGYKPVAYLPSFVIWSR